METKNKIIIVELITFLMTTILLIISVLGLSMLFGLSGYIITEIYSDETIVNKGTVMFDSLLIGVPFMIVFIHLTLGSYYGFKRSLRKYLEKFFDYLGD